MIKDKLVVRPKPPKGEDGYRTFSIRIKETLMDRIEDISKKTGRSRNELITLFLEYALDNCEVEAE